MRKLAAGLSAIAVLSLALAADMSAQAKPDFSGKWTLISSTAADAVSYPGRAADLMFGSDAVVTQEATTLTIVPAGSSNHDRFVLTLDGSESRNTHKESPGKTWSLVSRANWEGSTLVITTIVENVAAIDGASTTVLFRDTTGDSQRIMRWSMTASGELAMQTTALHILDTLGSARGPVTHTLVYKKIGTR